MLLTLSSPGGARAALLGAALAAALVSRAVLAAPAAAGAPAAERPLLFTAAHLFDARRSKLVSPGAVLVKGGRVAAVGAAAEEPGAERIDLGDATLLPGLIDVHVHFESERSDDFRKDRLDALEKPIAELALEAAERARRTLHAGFTTVRVLGSPLHLDLGLRNAIVRGLTEGPRIIAAGSSLGSTGGHCDGQLLREGLTTPDPLSGVADGPEALRAAVRRQIKAGANVIKACVTGGVTSENDDIDVVQLTEAEMNAIVEEAHALRRRVAVHAHGALGAKRAIRAGADSIEHGTFLDDEALDLMKARGTVLVPTPLNQRYYDEQLARGARIAPKVLQKMKLAAAARRDSVKRALQKGVRIAFGTDAGVFPHGRNAEQLAILVDFGMQPADALRAATLGAAELLDLDGEVGVLEPGKSADLIAVPGDVLADVRATEHVLLVVQGGRVVRRE